MLLINILLFQNYRNKTWVKNNVNISLLHYSDFVKPQKTNHFLMKSIK